MVRLKINGIEVEQEKGTTLLEAAQFLGLPIPTLCHMESLTPYGACRLCVVELGEGPKSKLVTSCNYPVEEGLVVHTSTKRVVNSRKMIIELMLASSPQSKTIQDLASAHDVRQQRFRQEDEDCILCGRCVRVCEEQMMAKAIGFHGRGEARKVGTPFDMKSDVCRTCGACMYVCPVCELRCSFTDKEHAICGGCANLGPPCIDEKKHNELMCYMQPCVACEINDSTNQTNVKGK